MDFYWSVVSTVVSKVLFARFRIVEHILTILSFLCDVINCKRKNELDNYLFTPLLVHFVSNTYNAVKLTFKLCEE